MADLRPEVTLVALDRFEPWMVTVFPPATGPALGSTALTTGVITPMVVEASGWKTYGGGELACR